ncbi:MAG: hypothetical protein H6963_06025 [Chromatiaceae bacterium]|nr:hypothetical protein [Chromatiaceae bacterium]MCP5408837.1 hypothetical protein [Chromatiaceae bacterium]MCP5445056.1 hypothetical protein [Chromatiaceae bacterium]
MIILIPDLAENTSPDNLHQYVSSCMKNVWLLPVFRKKGSLEKCEILRIKDRDSNQVQYQGLAYIDDDITGEALIKQLNNCHFQGINLKPRVYHSRAATKERRVNLADSNDIAIVNRRRRERRRSNLLIEKIASPVTQSAFSI